MDTGHIDLLSDLGALMTEAERFEFHDFKSGGHPMPKIDLINKLNDLAKNVKDGKYDNTYGA